MKKKKTPKFKVKNYTFNIIMIVKCVRGNVV